MTGHTDFNARYDTRYNPAARKIRSDEEWEGLWHADDLGARPGRMVELGIAALGAAVALLVVQRGWRRVSAPVKRFVPSAADIHVRMPPPR